MSSPRISTRARPGTLALAGAGADRVMSSLRISTRARPGTLALAGAGADQFMSSLRILTFRNATGSPWSWMAMCPRGSRP